MIAAAGTALIRTQAGEAFEAFPFDLCWAAVDRHEERGVPVVVHEGTVEFEDQSGQSFGARWIISESPPGIVRSVGCETVHCSVERDFAFYWEHDGAST